MNQNIIQALRILKKERLYASFTRIELMQNCFVMVDDRTGRMTEVSMMGKDYEDI